MKSSSELTQLQLDTLFPKDAFGIYIHVPFCERRCKYCAFVSSIWRPVPSEDYANALCHELEDRILPYHHKKLLTIYWGGGTPTMLEDSAIEKVMNQIMAKFNTATEITIEANPEHITPQRAYTLKALGFNRVSLGVQSFDDNMLSILGRRHDKQRVFDAISALRHAQIDEICIDLIYGAKTLENDDKAEINRWQKELEIARSISPAHISCYELTLENNTPLCTAQNRGHHIICNDDTIAEMMLIIPETLGMTRYEISNYSRDNYFSAHNVSCWAGLPYLGLGPGAHSLHLDSVSPPMPPHIERRANSNHIRKWLQSFKTDNTLLAPEFTESLTPHEHLSERLMCAARTRLIWNPLQIATSIQADLQPFQASIDKAVRYGFIERKGTESFQTTEKGIALNNRLDSILFEAF